MTLDDTSVHGRTPVIVGVGQYMERGRSPTESLSPMGIAAAAGAAALKDTGAAERVSETLDALVSVRIFPDSWNRPRSPNPFGRAENPPYAIASRLGLNPELGVYGNVGGNTPQKYINEMASRIAAGELKLAMVVGGEALKTAQLARRENLALDWQESDERPFEDRGIGEALATAHEFAHGLGVPIQTYPLFESALRAQAGHSLDAHLRSYGGDDETVQCGCGGESLRQLCNTPLSQRACHGNRRESIHLSALPQVV